MWVQSCVGAILRVQSPVGVIPLGAILLGAIRMGAIPFWWNTVGAVPWEQSCEGEIPCNQIIACWCAVTEAVPYNCQQPENLPKISGENQFDSPKILISAIHLGNPGINMI